jgi:magnesium-transporting ATPase (P-type)
MVALMDCHWKFECWFIVVFCTKQYETLYFFVPRSASSLKRRVYLPCQRSAHMMHQHGVLWHAHPAFAIVCCRRLIARGGCCERTRMSRTNNALREAQHPRSQVDTDGHLHMVDVERVVPGRSTVTSS